MDFPSLPLAAGLFSLFGAAYYMHEKNSSSKPVSKKPVLTYFGTRGLAEMVRLMLAELDIDYEEKCISTKEEWQNYKNTTKSFNRQVPCLEIDGKVLTQSLSIVRYLATRGNLYGSTPDEQIQCNIIGDTVRDFFGQVTAVTTAANREIAIEDVKTKTFPKYFPLFEDHYQKNNSTFLVGKNLSWPDITFYEVLEYCIELDKDCLQPYPNVKKSFENLRNRPNLKKHMNSSRRLPPSNEETIKRIRSLLQ